MAQAIRQQQKQCSYQRPPDWHCPFDAESGHELCIFHLPLDKKDPTRFWQEFAAYLRTLYGNAGTKETEEFVKESGEALWFAKLADATRLGYYSQFVRNGYGWQFIGFIFPAMDNQRHLRGLIFHEANFAGAQFSGEANFTSARFSGEANFTLARFSGEANFTFAQFSGEANFTLARFSGEANFLHTWFGDKVANFTFARFSGEVNFRQAQFSGEANFQDSQFSGPAYFSQATVNDLFDFTRARLRNRLLFEGTKFADKARVLVWGLDFVYGTSDTTATIDLKKRESLGRWITGTTSGQIVEPAGQVVFRDISQGMNRVSFLHTDILRMSES
jgi:uncharacterized protein YjbI with pentapeptide repeats